MDAGTEPLEAEIGTALNEPVNVATRLAIELAVCNLIEKGEQKNLWAYKEENKQILKTDGRHH